jgi:hypothetical protein
LGVGLWEWPDRIYLVEWVCEGDPLLLEALAHELAHMIECGSDEACAVRTTEEWLAAGVTLTDLGWP